MRFLLLLLPVFGFAQTGFRAEFNYLVSGTPSQGGDYRLTGLYADGDALGFPVDSVVAGSYFYDSKGLPYEIVYSSRSQPLTIEVDRVGHLMAPTIGLGLLTDRTSRKLLPYETSKIAGKLRSIIEVETRKLTDVDANKLAELLDVDTSGLADAYMIRYNADSAKWYVYPNNIDGLTDGYRQGNNFNLGGSYPQLTTGESNTGLGINASTLITSGKENVNIGSFSGNYNSQGIRNVNVGYQANIADTIGSNNIHIGSFVNSTFTWAPIVGNVNFNQPGLLQSDSVLIIGNFARSLTRTPTNEIVLGNFAVGNGSNTATLGNDNITGTYLKGNINLRGYGAGNKEAGDLSKTATNYVLRPASDGTILEQENNIDGLTDATYDLGNQSNLFLGSTKTLPIIPGPANNGNIGIGFAAFDSLKYGQENLGIAIGVAVNADSLFRSIGIGKNSMGGYSHTQGIYHTKATESVYLGLFAGGMDSLSFQSTQIGTYTNEGIGTKKRINRNGVLIGYAAKSLQDSSVYETAIGANVTGNGDSTATIGQTFLKGTYLNGNINLRGYGLGNKEASDISKTRSKYIAAFATDGTLLELDTTGLFGAASGASSFSDLNDIDTTGLQDNYAFRYNSSTGLFEAKANNIDGLDDGYKQGANLFLGREPFPGYTGVKNIIITNDGADSLRNPDIYGRGMVAIGSNVADKMKTASFESVYIGSNAAENSTQSYASVFIGGQSGMNANGQDNIYIGVKAGKNLSTQSGVPDGLSSRNTIIGTGASEGASFGSYNTAIGYLANLVNGNYQIVIGSGSVEPFTGNVSKGPNSAKIGSIYTDSTFLFGNLNLEGYGLGNKEAGDLSKTATNYVLRPASDGTILEQENNIDGLSDATKDANFNLRLGFNPLTTATGQFNTGVSASLYNLTTGNLNTASGYVALGKLQTGDDNTVSGYRGFFENKYGDENTGIGTRVNDIDTIGSFNTIAGANAAAAGRYGFTENIGDIGKVQIDSAAIFGARAKTLNAISTNEIVIGAFATGNGSNTATLGNNNITATYLKGTTNLSGYGLGNKEASDLSKTGSGYFLEVATDGTLIESTFTGGLQLSDLSVTVNSPGSANLQYDTITGVFSYTPPDLSSYLTSEVDGSTTNEIQSLSFNEATRELTLSSDGTIDLTEGIQDEIAATLVQGEGITITYNDVAGTITVAAPSGAGNTDEQTLSINSATAELSISNGNTVDLSEAIDNQVNTLFVDGTNILSTYDDGANTLTVRTTDALTQIDAITFDNNTTDAVTGRLQYNQEIGTLVVGLQNNTPLQLGTDMGWYVKNQSGASIAKGTPVYVSGTDGASGRKLISPMIANGTINAKLFLGITAETIANGGDGLVLGHGGIKGVNLSAFSANDVLYVSPTVAGTLTATQPTAPNLKLPIGYVVNNSSNGSLSIRSTIGAYLSESHDVQIAGASNGQVLKYDGTKWVNGTDLVNDADADPNNEIQTMTGVNGIAATATGNNYSFELGGSLTKNTTIDAGSFLFQVKDADNSNYFALNPSYFEVKGVLYQRLGYVFFDDYGAGNMEAVDQGLTEGNYIAGFDANGQLIDVAKSQFIQDLSLSGNTLSLTGDATTVDLSAYVNAVVTASNGLTLSGTDVKLGGTLSDATTTINAATNNFTFDNVSSFQLEANTFNAYQDDATNGYYGAIGFNSFGNYGVGMIKNIGGVYNQSKLTGNINGGLTLFSSIVDPGTSKEYDRILSMDDATNDLTLKAIDLAPATDLFTEISLSSTYLKIKTPNVTTGTASTGQVLKLTDASTGQVEYQTDIDAMVIACSDEITDITTGTAKVTFRAPFAMTITGVRASLATASSSGTPTVDINEAGVSILGTKLSIDANEKTSTTAATAATITDTAITDDAEITIDIDAAGTGAKGLKVTILYRK